jgi:hypothetical protein
MRSAGRTVGRRGRALAALALAGGLVAADAAPAAAVPAPRRADLDAARRRVALLEAERALTATRKPYLVLDLGARTLRYSLMGMEVRRVDLGGADASGLRPAPADGAAAGTLLAGIVTLREKDDDPRLSPLTPEQIEAGLSDEDAADVMPPEAPADYRLKFHQRVDVRVATHGEGRASGAVAAVRRFARRVLDAAFRRPAADGLRLVLHVDETTAREVYRSLVPGQRLVIVPPAGFALPAIGQEPPSGIKPGRPAPRPVPQPKPGPGIPFQIPPPVEGVEGAPSPGAPEAGPPPDAPPDGEPGHQPPGGDAGEAEPVPAEPEGGPPLPDDWEEADPAEPEPGEDPS